MSANCQFSFGYAQTRSQGVPRLRASCCAVPLDMFRQILPRRSTGWPDCSPVKTIGCTDPSWTAAGAWWGRTVKEFIAAPARLAGDRAVAGLRIETQNPLIAGWLVAGGNHEPRLSASTWDMTTALTRCLHATKNKNESVSRTCLRCHSSRKSSVRQNPPARSRPSQVEDSLAAHCGGAIVGAMCEPR
jgi:hypothetical protein